jgi:uncharacterized protein (TIGR02266 family)
MLSRKSSQYPRLKIRWPVYARTAAQAIAGETENISTRGAYIRCSQPLRLNEVLDITIDIPDSDRTLTARAEVVWSNIYGPDDKITPRGMGVRFLDIAREDRKFIAEVLCDHRLVGKVATKYLKTLEMKIGKN